MISAESSLDLQRFYTFEREMVSIKEKFTEIRLPINTWIHEFRKIYE